MPGLRLGLHLVLVEGRSALGPDEIAQLTDQDGSLRSDMVRLAFELVANSDARRQLRREITAQFDLFRRTGLALDHVNAHKHFQLHPVVLGMIAAVGKQYGMRAMRVPVEPGGSDHPLSGGGQLFLRWWASIILRHARAQGLVVPDAVYGLSWSGAMTQPRVLSLLRSLPDGIVEIYTHPATRDDFPGHALATATRPNWRPCATRKSDRRHSCPGIFPVAIRIAFEGDALPPRPAIPPFPAAGCRPPGGGRGPWRRACGKAATAGRRRRRSG